MISRLPGVAWFLRPEWQRLRSGAAPRRPVVKPPPRTDGLRRRRGGLVRLVRWRSERVYRPFVPPLPIPFRRPWRERRRRTWKRPQLAFTRIQGFAKSTQFTSTAVASTAVVLGSAVAVSDLVCLMTAVGDDSSNRNTGNCWAEPATVTDQLGNVWLRLSYEQGGCQYDVVNNQSGDWWWCIIAFAGTPTITYTLTANHPWLAIKGSHFTGSDANSFRRLTNGQQQINPGNGADAIIAAASIGAQAGDIIWAASGDPGSATATLAAGTNYTFSTVDATTGLADEWKTAVGNDAATFTDATNGSTHTYLTACIVITTAGSGTGSGDAAGPTVVQAGSIPNTNGVPVDGMPGMLFRLPEPSGAGIGGPEGGPGNCLWLFVRYTKNAATAAITDDQGNAWPASPTVTNTDNTGLVTISAWVLPNARQNTREIRLVFTGGAPLNFSGLCGEDYNTSGVVDGTTSFSTGAGAAATAWDAGSFTPANASGLVHYFACCQDSTIAPAAPYISSIVTLLTTDVIDGLVSGTTQQVGHPAINPSITVPTAKKYSALAFCLRASAQGTPPVASSMRIRLIQHSRIPVGNTSTAIQFPATGSLIALGGGGTYSPNTGFSGITDTNSNTYTLARGATNLFVSQIFYAQKPTTAPGLVLTLASATVSGAEIILWDVVNGGGLDTTAQATGSQGTPGGDLTTTAITPSAGPTLILCVGDQNRGTILGLVGRDTFFLDVPRWPRVTFAQTGQDEEDGTGGAGNSFTLDSQRGHCYSKDGSTSTFKWTNTRGAGQGTLEWVNISAAFKQVAPIGFVPMRRQTPGSRDYLSW